MIGATLFSGIGAPEQAMPHWQWPWHAEIEKFPAAVMAARHPHSVNLGDVTADDFTTRAAEIGRPDVLVFGSPCQSYSVAGKRLGLDDPRGNLALVALGIVDRLKPRWFVFENVPGLLSSSEGRDFGLFLRAVDELGYSLCWSVLDAQHFGVAQRRQRVFAVGYLGDWRYPAAVLLEPQGLCGDHPPRRGAREGVTGTIGAGSPRCGQRIGADEAAAGQLVASLQASLGGADDNDAREGRLVAFGGNDTRGPIDVATALNAHGGPCGRMDFESETLIAFDTTQVTSRENRSQPELGEPCHPLAAGAHPPAVAFNWQGGGKQTSLGYDPSSGVAGVLEADQVPAVAFSGRARGDDGRGYERPPASMVEAVGAIDTVKPWNVASRSAVRRLTPRECERLQGFPDDFTAITYRGKRAADGPRYKALGNSMAVPVVRWILERIEFVNGLASSSRLRLSA